MNLFTKKHSIIILILTSIFLLTSCGDEKKCILCDGYGKLACVVCEKNSSNDELCQFCDGNSKAICTLCDGTGIENK